MTACPRDFFSAQKSIVTLLYTAAPWRLGGIDLLAIAKPIGAPTPIPAIVSAFPLFTMVSWSVPLFLFQSLSNQDTALLAQPPSSLALAHNLSLGVGGSWDNYTLVYDEPVAYGASLDDSAPSYPLVTLKAYWSPSRCVRKE